MGARVQACLCPPRPGLLLSLLPRLPLRCLLSLCSHRPPVSLCPAWCPAVPTSPDTSDRRESRDPSHGTAHQLLSGAPPCLLNKHMPRSPICAP